MQISKAGFRASDIDAVELSVKQSREVDVTLQVGSSSEKVEVTAAAVALDTQNASQEQVIVAKTISALPLKTS